MTKLSFQHNRTHKINATKMFGFKPYEKLPMGICKPVKTKIKCIFSK